MFTFVTRLIKSVLPSLVMLALSLFMVTGPAAALGGLDDNDSTPSPTQSHQPGEPWQPSQQQPAPVPAPSPAPAPGTNPGNVIEDYIDDVQNQNPHDEGDILEGGYVDTEQLQQGYGVGRQIFRGIGWLTGWLVAFLVAMLGLVNLLGLIYVAIPISVLRSLLSGGLHGNTNQNSMASGARMGGMGMGGMGMARPGIGMGMGGMGMGGMPSNTQPSGNSIRRMTGVVPSTAINAVNLAESGQGGGQGGGRMGTMTPMGQQGQSAEQVNPVTYYLRQQSKELIFVGVALVVLVLSSALFDAGLNIGEVGLSIVDSILDTIGIS